MEALGKVWNRLLNMVRIGQTSTNATESGTVQTVQVKFNGLETRNGISTAQLYGFASSPLPGCSVVVLNLAGSSGHGVIVATNDHRYRPTDMQPGEIMVYDNIGQMVHLKTDGTIYVKANTSITVDSPNLFCTGDLSDKHGSLDRLRQHYNAHTHSDSDGDSTTTPEQDPE